MDNNRNLSLSSVVNVFVKGSLYDMRYFFQNYFQDLKKGHLLYIEMSKTGVPERVFGKGIQNIWSETIML